jgi:protein gp37
VIVGGESGFGARVMKREWVISVRRQCRKQDVPFFFKQWGGVRKSRNGRKLDGRTYDEMPIEQVIPQILESHDEQVKVFA